METAIYYTVLFLIIFVVNFFTRYRQSKTYLNGNSNQKDNTNNSWMNYSFFGLNLMYASAGLVILVINSIQDNNLSGVPVVIIVYVLFLLISAYTDNLNDSEDLRLKFFLNVLVILFAFAVPWILKSQGNNLFGKNVIPEHTRSEEKDFQVVLPYRDLTLERHLGQVKGSQIQMLYKTQVKALNRDQAIAVAKENFSNDSTITVVYDKYIDDIEENPQYYLLIDDRDAAMEMLQ